MKLKKKLAVALASLAAVSAIGITAAASTNDSDIISEIHETTVDGKYVFKQTIWDPNAQTTPLARKLIRGMTSTVKATEGIPSTAFITCRVVLPQGVLYSASNSAYVFKNNETVTMDYLETSGIYKSDYRLAVAYATNQTGRTTVAGYWTP